MILRIIAVLFLGLAAGSGIYGLFEGGFLILLGEVWFAVAPGSLNLTQAVTQRYIAPELWDPGITWVLNQPAVAVFGLLGLAFMGPSLLRGRR